MKKRSLNVLYSGILLMLLNSLPLTGQPNGKILKVNSAIKSIEVSTTDIDIFISAYKEDRISYKTELMENTKLSITREGRYLRFTELYPAKGRLYIYIPENMVLEGCRIQSINSKIEIEGIKSVYFVVSAIQSNINVKKTRLKNALVTIADGNLKFESGIVAVADFSVSNSKALISVAEPEAVCELSVTRDSEKGFVFNGTSYTKKTLKLRPKKPKKFISVSTSFTELVFNFIPPLKEPDEKFDKYGISEFGPKRPPSNGDSDYKFIPRQTK